jgi:hypothetical protein
MYIYINEETGERYHEGRSITMSHNGVLFSGIPTSEQLKEWGYVVYTPPTPTEDEIAEQQRQARMDEILTLLRDTDYIVLKKSEGIDISLYDEKYGGDFLSWRQSLRNEFNELENAK